MEPKVENSGHDQFDEEIITPETNENSLNGLNFLKNNIKIHIKGNVFQVPKFVLVKSEKFKEIIDQNDFNGTIDITDEKAEQTVQVIRYLCGKDIEEPLRGLEISLEHNLQEMSIICQDKITDEMITNDNVCDIFQMKGLSDIFRNRLKRHILTNLRLIVPNLKWVTLNKNHPELVIELFDQQ